MRAILFFSERTLSFRRIILGCAIALPAGAILIFAAEAARYTATESQLHAWQDLIAGVLALTGAAVGAYFLNRQTMQSMQQEGERRRRRHMAVRAVMPLTLSTLTSFAEEVVSALVKARSQEAQFAAEDAETGASSDPVPVVLPKLPDSIAPEFAALIESVDERESKAIYDLLVNLQLQIARLYDLSDIERRAFSIDATIPKYRIITLNRRIYEAVFIHASAGALFPYARNLPNSEAGPATWDMLQTSLVVLGLGESDENQDLYDLISAMKRSNELPRL